MDGTKQISLQAFTKKPEQKKKERIFRCPICGTKRHRRDMRKLVYQMQWEKKWHKRLVCLRCHGLAEKENYKNKRRRMSKRKSFFFEPKTKEIIYFELLGKPPLGPCPCCGLAKTSLTYSGICFECQKQKEAGRKRKEELNRYVVHE